MRNQNKILVGKTEGKRTLGSHWRKWKDNIKLNIREKGLEGVDWIYLARDTDWWRAHVDTVMNLRVPL
jgi:hypothetical protein